MNRQIKNHDTSGDVRRASVIVAASALLFLLVWMFPEIHKLDPPNLTWLHTVMELFAIVVALAIFAVVWNVWAMERLGHLVVLACAFLVVGLVDIGHTLSFKGMPVFVTPSGGGKAIYFWFVARWVTVLALIYVALRPQRAAIQNTTRYTLLAVALGLVAVTYWAILFHQAELPAMYTEAKALSPLKVGLEFALIAAFGFAAMLFYRTARRTDQVSAIYLTAAAIVSMLSEACFASYASPTDAFNILGHVFKVIAYGLMFRAIFVEAVHEPFLRARYAEEEVNQLEGSLRLAITASQIGLWDWDVSTHRVYFSPEWKQQIGYADDELPNRYEEWESRLHPDDREQSLNRLREYLANPVDEHETVFRLRHREGAYRTILARGKAVLNEHGAPTRMVGMHLDITERERAEQALRASQARLNAMLESSPVPFAVNDAQGNITYLNPKFVRTFGYTLTDIPTLADWWPRAYPDPVYREHVMALWGAAVAKALRDGVEVEPMEIHIACKDGSQRYVLANPAPMDDSHLVFLYDITERKQAELALQESLHFAKLIANNVPGMLAYWTADFRCAFANDAYLAWFGYTAEQMVGMSMMEVLGEALFRKNEPYIRAALQGEAQQFERTLIKSNGETGYTWAQYIPRMVDGQVHGFFALVIDITQLKLSEQALRESEIRLNKAQEIAHLGSWELDLATNHLSWSDEVYRIFGLQPRAFAATYEAFVERVHPDDRDAVNAAYVNSVRDGLDSYEIEHRIIRAGTGEVRYVHEKCGHVRDAAGEVTRSVGMVHDITERVMLQKQSVQAQKMQAIGQLTGGIAHDFNNILASILGYTDLALDRFVPDKESKLASYLIEVKRASERARDLIAKMLAFSRGGKGESQCVAVAPMIAEVEQLLHSVLPSSVTLTTQIEPDVPMVMVDPVHLHQILMNLCINARDAVGTHGRIEIGVTHSRPTHMVCASCLEAVQGEWVEIWVRDNGAGIDPDTLPHVFEPFFSTKVVGKGTGMGLATVHGLVHGYGGHVMVESVVNGGTTVRLFLPAGSNSTQGLETARVTEAPAQSAGGHTILVVDDERPLAHMLGEMLEHHGFAAHVFSDALAALEAFRAHPGDYAALVTDYTMPGLTGIELSQAVMALRPDLPIVLCSGYADKIDATKLEALGVRRFFLKPVKNQVLLQALDELLAAKK